MFPWKKKTQAQHTKLTLTSVVSSESNECNQITKMLHKLTSLYLENGFTNWALYKPIKKDKHDEPWEHHE